MKLNPKMLAVSAALLGLLAGGAALPAGAASPFAAAPAAISLPWLAAEVESVETGSYASTMTVGTAQQLSPVILPAKAARTATVTFLSNDPTIVSVTSEGVAQAVGVGTAQVVASANGVSCVYTITTELDDSMIVKEMDITLASNTISVGDTTSLSLGVLPTSASNYASVSLSSSNPAVATVNNFGKVTGVAPGTATITATCGDVTASATIKVVNSGVDRQSIDLNTTNYSNGAGNPFRTPFYLILNSAVGGNWCEKAPKDGNGFPIKFLIDYVRFYQTKEHVEQAKQFDPATGLPKKK